MRTLRSPSSWLTAIARPETRVELDLHGLPALYTAHAGWRTGPRPFGQHLLYFVVHGSFRARLEKREETLRAGDLLWLAPWAQFECWLPGTQPVTFYRFRLTVRERGNDLRHHSSAHIARGIESARPWIEEIVRGPDSRSPLRSWRLRGALLGLFADILAPSSRASTAGKLDARQQEALNEAMTQGNAARITPAQLATRLRLSPDYFARLFRRTYRMSPRAWIVRQRIRMAAVRLLESRLGIGEVADEFGYRDIYFFSRQFKQVMGRSPRDYRRGA